MGANTICDTVVEVEQALLVAVAVNMVDCVEVVLFTKVLAAIVVPVPLAAAPVISTVLVLLHEKVVPARLLGLLIVIALAIVPPLQISARADGVMATVGVGLTDITTGKLVELVQVTLLWVIETL
jgi:hypothetical protein